MGTGSVESLEVESLPRTVGGKHASKRTDDFCKHLPGCLDCWFCQTKMLGVKMLQLPRAPTALVWTCGPWAACLQKWQQAGVTGSFVIVWCWTEHVDRPGSEIDTSQAIRYLAGIQRLILSSRRVGSRMFSDRPQNHWWNSGTIPLDHWMNWWRSGYMLSGRCKYWHHVQRVNGENYYSKWNQ